MTARAEDLLFVSLLASKDERIRVVSDEPGVQEKGLLILGFDLSDVGLEIPGGTDKLCETGSPSTWIGATSGPGSGLGSMAEVLITDLINFFALFLGPDSFPNIIVIELFLFTALRFLDDFSGLTRVICIRCGRMVRVWKMGGTGVSSRWITRCILSGR